MTRINRNYGVCSPYFQSPIHLFFKNKYRTIIFFINSFPVDPQFQTIKKFKVIYLIPC